MPSRYEPPPPFGHESDEWMERFGRMAVNGPPTASLDNSDGSFVGGFSALRPDKPLPAVPSTVDQAWQSPSMMRMPEPARRTSLTMQHALGGAPVVPSVPSFLRPGVTPGAGRPYSAPIVQNPTSPVSIGKLPNPNSPPATPPASSARRNGGSALRPPVAPSSAGRAHSAPSAPGKSPKTPKTPTRAPKGRRSSSIISISSEDSDDASPSSTLSGPGTPGRGGQKVPCIGFTQKGQPCKRMVIIGPDSDPDAERLCHQHAKKFKEEVKSFFARGNGQPVLFADWIPDYLSDYTQEQLRREMEKATSKGEEPGYIYTFHIDDPSTPGVVHLKIGRTVNLNQRIYQWARQCGSRDQTLRGYWPGSVQTPAAGEDDEVTTLLRGHVNAGPPGKGSHRLERLIHLELADLVENAQYLDPKWPKAPSSTPVEPKKNKEKCSDCGTTHKEIFTFTRGKGKYKNKEWELIVMPVISKWGSFVEQFC